MSYQVLARKWRPQNFEELVGQEHVLGALVNALENERLHHAYLFSGTRGVGKTTIARILARSLNCDTGITSKPCGECASCVEISEGRFVDLIEVDAASRTKVEDTRDLLENVQYKPTRGRFKIYLIDEVHMLSNHSFNALLKTLEEPPEHVKFLLATTDPQKLPVTVLSRCLQFNLKNLPALRISEYLEQVLNDEKVPFEKNALGHLARAAAGSMRDALSLTDQAISHGGGKLSEQDVVEMLGTVDRKRIYEIVDALSAQDGSALVQHCQDLAQYSVDYLALLEEMLSLFHAMAVQQVVPDIDQTGFGDSERVAELAQRLSAEDVQLSYQMLLMGRKDLAASPDMHLGFEMLMLRLLAFQPESKSQIARKQREDTTQSDQAGSVQEGFQEGQAEVGKAQEGPPAKKPEAAAKTKPHSSSEAEEASAADNAGSEDEAAKLAEEDQPPWDAEDNPDYSSFEPSNQQGSPEPTAEVAPPEINEPEINDPGAKEPNQNSVTENQPSDESQILVAAEESEADESAPKTLEALNSQTWISLYRQLPLDGVVKSVVGHMVLEEQNMGKILFRLAESGQPLFNPNHQQRLADVLTAYFGHPVEIDVELGGVQRETPAENARRLHREALEAAEKSMLSDPLVGELMREFQAKLVPDSVTICDESS